MTTTIIQADARHLPLADRSVNCCVTSPPYFGLRDYGTAKWEGGSAECDHARPRLGGNGPLSLVNGGGSDRDESARLQQYRDTCAKCGATRIDAQIGLEPTPAAYVEEMVKVFREVRRVLRDDGTLWLNLGDSYAGSWGNYGGQNRGSGTQREIGKGSAAPNPAYDGLEQFKPPTANKMDGIKPKDLIGIPWMVAFALRADGWYLRQDIIWAKPNPMPESVTDRCTKAHEYIFLLSKSAKYYYNAQAVQEDATSKKGGASFGKQNGKEAAVAARMQSREYDRPIYTKRNRRSVWTVATKSYKGAHFATFPPKLIEPCILAGSPIGGTVLDPFAGSGTTLRVAADNGRHAIGIELNPDYIALAHKRLAEVAKKKPTRKRRRMADEQSHLFHTEYA